MPMPRRIKTPANTATGILGFQIIVLARRAVMYQLPLDIRKAPIY
jgi:hypothetical protein